jgi:hypothetical protein
MSKASPKKIKPLEVQIMFEPNRLQHNYLHQAYVYLVPIAQRRLAAQDTVMEVSALSQVRERNVL